MGYDYLHYFPYYFPLQNAHAVLQQMDMHSPNIDQFQPYKTLFSLTSLSLYKAMQVCVERESVHWCIAEQ